MRFLFIVFFPLALPILGQSQVQKNPYTLEEKEAIAVVNSQIEAYNDQNLDLFLSFYSDAVVLYGYPETINISGKSELKSAFETFFSNAPNLNCEITNRMVLGNKIIDQELVTGFSENDTDEMRAVAIYSIDDGKISEVRFIRK